MLTIAELWDLLSAIEQIALAHQLTLSPSFVVDPNDGERYLRCAFRRGRQEIGGVDFSLAMLSLPDASRRVEVVVLAAMPDVRARS